MGKDLGGMGKNHSFVRMLCTRGFINTTIVVYYIG